MTLTELYYALSAWCAAWALLLFWFTGYQHPATQLWIMRVWNQRQHHKTTWWQCARAHIALEMGRWDYSSVPGITMATETVGFYSDGDIVGTSIEILNLRGFRVHTTMDDTL